LCLGETTVDGQKSGDHHLLSMETI